MNYEPLTIWCDSVHCIYIEVRVRVYTYLCGPHKGIEVFSVKYYSDVNCYVW